MDKEDIGQALTNNGIILTDLQIGQLERYLELLNRWNKTYNLTAIKDRKDQVYKHIIDSLSTREAVLGSHILDVGTGPGLPGIPLAILFPEKHFTLVDCSQKRIIFLKQAVRQLSLNNVKPFHQRIEQATPDTLESTTYFDIIISRAFSSIRDFIDKTQHLLAENGVIIAMKGTYPREELNQIPQDFCVKDVRELSISGLHAERHLVIVQKHQPESL